MRIFCAIESGRLYLLTILLLCKVSSVERFLEKANTGRSRSSSRGSSPGRSPLSYDSIGRNSLVDEHIHGFKVNIKQDKKSKFSSIVLKLRGIDQVFLPRIYF